MDRFTARQLRELLEHRNGLCVSIFMPTHPGTRDIREDPLRCKNLLDEAEKKLIAAGMRGPDARAVLEPAWQLQADSTFWSRQSEGLILFAAPGFFRWWRLPLRLDEQLTVSQRFHITPVLPLLQDDGRFYLLALSQKKVRLFEGSHYSIAEIMPERLPTSLVDALQIGIDKGHLQMHAALPAQGPNSENEVRTYFRTVSDRLEEFLREERAPLVFAGVDSLFPMFRASCGYRFLVPEAVTGSADLMNSQELHEKAWKVVAPYFRERLNVSLRRYNDAAGVHLTATELQPIIKAAWMGAIDALYVAKNAAARGSVDEQTGDVKEAAEGDTAGEDLIDYAVSHTIMGNGTVYLLDPHDVPGEAPMAALLRYPVPAPQSAT